jgi:hypothetical protein
MNKILKYTETICQTDVNKDLIDDMGWLADMNRPSKEHSSVLMMI